MSVQLKDSDVNSLCIRFMNKLIQKIQKDDKARFTRIHSFKRACVDPNGETGGHEYYNSTLKNRVIDELLERGDIKMGVDLGEIKITEQGKNKAEYQLRD
jgi:hypothetical protein